MEPVLSTVMIIDLSRAMHDVPGLSVVTKGYPSSSENYASWYLEWSIAWINSLMVKNAAICISRQLVYTGTSLKYFKSPKIVFTPHPGFGMYTANHVLAGCYSSEVHINW